MNFCKFYSKELALGRGEFFREKNQHFFFGHMIHEIGLEFPQDHDGIIGFSLRPLVLELLPKNGN